MLYYLMSYSYETAVTLPLRGLNLQKNYARTICSKAHLSISAL